MWRRSCPVSPARSVGSGLGHRGMVSVRGHSPEGPRIQVRFAGGRYPKPAGVWFNCEFRLSLRGQAMKCVNRGPC